MVKTPRIVNDTNVWISALYFKGKPATIVNLIEKKKVTSVTSRYILDEIKSTMIEKPFYATTSAAKGTVDYIESISELVVLKKNDYGLRDLADNPILETAVVGKSNFLITGDKDLLSLRRQDLFKIVNPTQFLSEL
ncbi:putative toxin-antitoxin system toxin component, PIN family [Candidatus Roizmanbacteria bacterium RIFCSPLOWO2_01_FULL_37_12]|uniref:Putative toxin-antitoxin system toxin component, PIN family n=1 Tax=Candidatus Roizmanbacteria bacterium RIFCSPLOWO2_01_FULL_37_12 TaxID=1802056 RepID=A0A1F7IGE2_9BACT|nr:MAG: putative toxin-antitoxin system toxin component, PIN family [Candidatus Roizmanbacteria bacterium RIFCSPHIGHO2_02_FULL_37_9b]OGK42411.1 MAG: putative toxin-antitoxin system toxin component, PIN family [Candidatus Roizmanbacteria bacterium RIFCSPLOWO2_01_FULL_37_12]